MGFFLQAFEAALSFEQANSSIRGVAENWAAERPVGTGRDRARNTTYQGLNFKKHSFVRDLNAEGFVFFLFHVAFSFERSLLGFKQIQASLLRCLCMFYNVCVCVCLFMDPTAPHSVRSFCASALSICAGLSGSWSLASPALHSMKCKTCVCVWKEVMRSIMKVDIMWEFSRQSL